MRIELAEPTAKLCDQRGLLFSALLRGGGKAFGQRRRRQAWIAAHEVKRERAKRDRDQCNQHRRTRS